MNPLSAAPSLTFHCPNRSAGFLSTVLIKTGITGIEILAVEMVGRDPQPLAKALVMYDLPFPQKFQGIADVRIVDKTEQIVVGGTRLLLCCHVLMHIGDDVPFALNIVGGPSGAGCGLWPDAGGMIDKVGIKPRPHNLFGGHIPGELVYHSGNHLKVGQFFCTYRSNGNVPIY